jgi:uncharacterized protein YbjT (DUF2867 family)
VRVLVRSEAKGAAWKAQGAEVAIGDIDNAESLTAALQGATGFYMLLPPDYGATDPMGRAHRICDIVAGAVEKAGVRQVTLLSSIGAELQSGNGIVQSLYIAEQRLAKLGIGLTFIRAAAFLENWASSLPAALGTGTLYSFQAPADRKIPTVATQDIGTIAAYSLMLQSPGTRIIELAGPEDLSPDEVAAALARVTGKNITVGVAPIEGMAPMLAQFGMSAPMAGEMAGLTSAINAGHINFGQPGTLLVRGTTSVDQVLSALLKAAPGHGA